MLTIRRPFEYELPELKKIHEPFEEQFKFPNPALLSSIYVVLDDDSIIGFGAVQPIFEAILVLKKDEPLSVRAEATAILQHAAEEELREVGQVHAFVQNTKVANFLKNRFGYQNTKGKSLVKIIGAKNGQR
jgi:hypothetical protein